MLPGEPDPSPSPLSESSVAVATSSWLDSIMRPVALDIEALDRALPGYVPAETTPAREVVSHVFDSGGKRIRPAIFFFCARLVGYRGEHLLPMAAVCEFVHTASILHDDVVDDSTVRRNKPTAQSIWGDESSVLVGDLIYSTASEMMAATGNLEIVTTFARAIRRMSEGELLQLEHIGDTSLSVDTYMRILDCKTAELISATCRVAGLLGGVESSMASRLADFGRHLGLAFQLMDDALDYSGVFRLLGKPNLADLEEGKVTLPLILLRERAPARVWSEIEESISVSPVNPSSASRIADYVKEFATAKEAIRRAESLTAQAIDALHHFPPCPERDDLEALACQLLKRAH